MVAAATNADVIKSITYAAFKTNLSLTKADVGLSNVDNTSDASKPVSTTQAAALALKADLASPTFTGDPKAPTPSAADNDTSIATTAYVTGAVTTATGGVNASLALKADIASPTFTGDPKAPTPSAADNDTSIATTAFVKTAIAGFSTPTAATVSFTPVGDIAATNVQAAITELAAEPKGYRNRIINGDFSIDQRNNGAVAAISAGAGVVYTVDRWWVMSLQAPGALTAQRVPDAYSILGNYALNTIVTAADASLAVGDVYAIGQTIEGNFVRDLGWGNASAQSITISFWTSCTSTMTLPISVRNAPTYNRVWLGSFTTGPTPSRVVLTIPGDQTGTWGKDNVAGMVITIGLGVGSSYQGVAGWQAGNFMTMAGMTNLMGTVSNAIALNNFQLEVGTVATEFERVPYDEQLARCRRYYEAMAGGGGWSGNVTTTLTYHWWRNFSVEKRAVPTIVFTNVSASGFGTTPGTAGAGTNFLSESRLSTSTVNAGVFNSSWTASAEL
jgi:hypothetical protein